MNKQSIRNIIIVVLAAVVFVQFLGQRSTLKRIEAQITEKNQVLEELNQKNETLRQEIINITSDEYIEKSARERLQMIKPGDIPVENVPASETESGANPDTSTKN